MAKQRSEIRGQLPTELIPVLDQAYECGFSVQSDFFRKHATGVALAASLGLITTLVREGYGSIWRITPAGMEALGIEWPV